MTQSKNIELTPEEQDEIAKRAPQLLKPSKRAVPLLRDGLQAGEENTARTARTA